MNKQKMSILLILMLIFVLFAGCDNVDDNLGDIQDITSINLADASDIPTSNTTKDELTEDGLHYVLNDYYAGFQYLYPKDFEKNNIAANHIEIRNKDIIIEIEHQFLASDDEGLSAVTYERLKELFDAEIQYQSFYLDGECYTRDYEQSPNGNLGNGISTLKGNKIIIGQDFTPLVVRTSVDSVDMNTASERRYYVYENGVASIYSVISTQEEFDNATEIIDNLVKSITPISQGYDKVYKKEIGNITYAIPEFFSSAKLSNVFGNGVTYACPADSNNSLAGAFIGIYPVHNKNLESNIKNISIQDILFDVYSDDKDVLNNNIYTNFEPCSEGYSPFEGLKSKGFNVESYETHATLLPTGVPTTRLFDAGNVWYFYVGHIEKAGSEAMIVLGAQAEKMPNMTAVMNNITF